MGVSLDGQEKEFVKQCDLEWVKWWCSQVDLYDGIVYLGISAVTYYPGLQWFQ